MGRKEQEVNQAFFDENEKQINYTISRALMAVFFVFPVLLILKGTGIFSFTWEVAFQVSFVGVICTLSPYLVCKFTKNQSFIKYYNLICAIALVSYLSTKYHVGIYITFILPAIMSCLYFDKKFTIRILCFSYIGCLLGYYFKSFPIAADLKTDPNPITGVYIPYIAGFTLEFLASLIFLYLLSGRTNAFLVKQGKLIENLQASEEMTKMAMDATKDIFFQYDIKEDFYISSGTIRGWKKKELRIPEFSVYAGEMGWETGEFIELFERTIHLPEKEGNHLEDKICIDFEENGIKYPAWAYFAVNILRNEGGVPIKVLGIARDITDEKVEELKRTEEKNHDPLTGMYHYAGFRRIVNEISETDHTHQIMVLHIQNYKEIGECYGEVYRDYIILNISDLIKKVIGDKNIYNCRLSEDIFLLYIENEEEIDGSKLRQILNNRLAELYIGEKEVKDLLFAFGFYAGTQDIEELLKIAMRYVGKEAEVSEYQGTEASVEKILHNEKRLWDIPEYKREEAVRQFNKNISTLILNAKDQAGMVQIILDRMGKFFDLDAIRVYEFPAATHAVFPVYYWGEEALRQKIASMPLSEEVQEVFVQNFAQSRIVDTTIGAFRELFKQYEGNPLLLSGFSSLIYPLSAGEVCKAVLIFDKAEETYAWTDEQKEQLLSASRILGNHLLIVLDSGSAKQKQIFLTTMSQMLRTPMNSIFELTDIARKSTDRPEELIGYMDMIDVSSENLLRVVNNIVDLSRMDMHAMMLNEQIFSLEDVLSRIEQKERPEISRKRISFLLERRFQENLLKGDDSRLEQVLSTLLKQAIHFVSLDGKIHLTVEEISRRNQMIGLRFSVEDNGPGIPDEAMPHIFEMLTEESQESSGREYGTELELGICYQLVKRMGGELFVKSELGKGTTFSFGLQFVCPPSDSLFRFMSQKKQEEENRMTLEGKKILIAEDDTINREILKRLFEKHGAMVEAAENGRKCLDLFQESAPGEFAFIIMDIIMPVMNGHDTTRAIRKLRRTDAKKIPILALSANAFKEDTELSLESGMNAHLTKPIHMDEIMRELGRVENEENRR